MKKLIFILSTLISTTVYSQTQNLNGTITNTNSPLTTSIGSYLGVVRTITSSFGTTAVLGPLSIPGITIVNATPPIGATVSGSTLSLSSSALRSIVGVNITASGIINGVLTLTGSAGSGGTNAAITGIRAVSVSQSGQNFTVNGLSEKVYNVEDFGAKHDYQTVTNAGINAGSNVLTTTSATFSLNDIGKTIRVFGVLGGLDLLTTITGFISPTQITLATNASTTSNLKQIEWATDDTPFIQSAINTAFVAGGGTVYHPKGVYYIASPLITTLNGVNINSQLYIPLSTINGVNPTIRIKGESDVNYMGTPFYTSDPIPLNGGTIWKSPIIGSGSIPAVISSSFFTNSLSVITNFTKAEFEDMAIQVKSKQGITHIAPTMSAFNMSKIEFVSFRNENWAFTESSLPFSVEPTVETYGFYMPNPAHSQSWSEVENIYASGYNVGIFIQEHETFNKLFAQGCVYGLRIGANTVSHVSGVGTAILHWNKYDINLVGGGYIFLNVWIEQWNAYLGVNKWYNGAGNVNVTNGNFYGHLTITNHNSGGAWVPVSFVGSALTGSLVVNDTYYQNQVFGGKSLITSFSQGGTGWVAGNPSFDPAVVEINRNKTTSTDQYWAALGLNHAGQSGTNNLVSIISSNNLAIGGADKRMWAKFTLTNGAINTARSQEYLLNAGTLTQVNEIDPTAFKIGINTYIGGITSPSARLHISAGTSSVPQLILNTSTGYTGTISGAISNVNNNITIYNAGLNLTTVGTGLRLSTGTNATFGTTTLSAGTATISTNKVTANSVIILTPQNLGTVSSPKSVGVTARSAGTSFTITSEDITDTSTVGWWIIEPN